MAFSSGTDQVLTIPDALGRAAESPEQTGAVVEGEARLPYNELHQRSLRVARSLIASGVQPGDRVALWAPNGVRWIEASFGIYAAGAVQVPLNTRFKSEEAAYVIRRSGARLLLTVTDFLGHDFATTAQAWTDVPELDGLTILSGDPGRHPGWDGWLEDGESVDEGEVSDRISALEADSVSDIIFTSGTTGAPKGAVLTHGASVRTYQAWTSSVGLRSTDSYLLVYPLFHTAGLKSGVLACVLTGASIHPFPVFDVDKVMAYVSRYRITALPGPPTVFQSILSHPDFDKFDLSSLRLSVTGAATVPVETIRRMREDLRFQTVVTGYGLTETTGTVSMCSHDDPPEIIAETVGRPLPGVEVKVVDDDGTEVKQGEAGEILVRGFNVMKEYFQDPEATAATIDSDGWLKTGDVGLLDEGGNIRITDRKKDMYIAGGFNVYPAELEGVMVRHPAVAQVAVIGIPDDRLGEVGQAVLVVKAGEKIDEAEFIAWCRDHMANYKVPRSVRVVDALPINPSGKVMKFRLREDSGQRSA